MPRPARPDLHLLALLPLALLTPSAVNAADKEGNYAVWGPGGQSCNRYNEARASGQDAEFRLYAMGYFTAYHTFVEDTYQLAPGKPFTDILAMVIDYCERTPMDSFERALKLTAEELAPHRRKTAAGRRGGAR